MALHQSGRRPARGARDGKPRYLRDVAERCCAVAVIAGLGVALVAPFNIHDELRAGSVVPLLPELPSGRVLDGGGLSATVDIWRRKVRIFIDALARASCI